MSSKRTTVLMSSCASCVYAAIVLSETKRHQPGDQLTLGQAVELIAEVGGYTGRRNSGGPPGTTVISRGLNDVLVVARVLSRAQKSG